MITIRPFAALRPKSGLESKIASRPYDVLSSEEARQEADGNEKSFYRVIKPEVNLDPTLPSNKIAEYSAAKNALLEFIEKGWLQYDQEEAYYLYRQKMGKIDQYGLVCLSSVDDYMNDRIKKHEYTRLPKKRTAFNTCIRSGPIQDQYSSRTAIFLNSMTSKFMVCIKQARLFFYLRGRGTA